MDSDSAAVWDGGATSLYSAWNGTAMVGYSRSAMQNYIGDDAEKLEAALRGLGLLKTHRLVFVGAGFGWVCEKFLALGYGPFQDGTANGRLATVDTSAWIQSNKNGNATLAISNADVNASTGRRAIKQLFGSNNAVIDWVVSEDVLPILTGTVIGQNNEIVPFAQSLRALANNVAHWLTTLTVPGAQDPRLNWKTLEDWKTWVSPDFVIARNENSRTL